MYNQHKGKSFTTLSKAQIRAIEHVKALAQYKQKSSRHNVASSLKRMNELSINIDHIMMGLQKNARVTLNFHPDRILPSGITVIEGLLEEGKYQSQFVTQMTNGSRTAYPGGERDTWEKILFGGAYHNENINIHEKPKYGALNVLNYSDGASPRFGSCFIQLYPHVLNRCTFTFGDSYTQPDCVGTIDVFEPILSELFASVENTQQGLGSSFINLAELVLELNELHAGNRKLDVKKAGRSLDDYIEVQIHGDIDLTADVELLVADPSYKRTMIGEQLEELCTRYSITLLWHSGFRMLIEAIPEDFRGPAIPPFARRVNRFAKIPGILDAETIGRAAASFYYQPEMWQDWADAEETFQHFKQLWHVLVKFGRQS